MSDGVAVTFTKEVLRAVQDVVSIHKALFATHAKEASHSRLHTKGYYACSLACLRMASWPSSWIRLATMSSMADEIFMADHVLVR